MKYLTKGFSNVISEGFRIWRNAAGSIEANFPQVVIHHSPDGFEIGYGGSGPADAALNILEIVQRLEGWAKDDDQEKCFDGVCSKTAFHLHQQFKWDVISKMNRNGGYILYSDVRTFIETNGNSQVAIFPFPFGREVGNDAILAG